MPPLPPDAQPFVQHLLAWYEDKKRDLPWRRTRDPYAVWISEMMLQQTLVATVITYWQRWMERFPTVQTLAEAPLEDVLKHWQGLGYYARARNLHRAAQVIVTTHGGAFPTRFDDVLSLPGIGRYTAGAICSIALGQDVPIVDANVIRVLCRYFGIEGDPKSAPVQERLWELATNLIPPGNASAFNQALMELGALVCQSQPRCGACPVSDRCVALATGDPQSLPQFAPRPVFTSHTDVSAIIPHPSGNDRLLLIRRPPEGLWGGLWEFPRVTAGTGEAPADAAERAAREVAGLEVRATRDDRVGTVRHGVTTHKITLLGIPCEASPGAQPAPISCAACEWVAITDLDRYALSSPQARLAAQVRQRLQEPTLFS